jgi:hypothetical protein
MPDMKNPEITSLRFRITKLKAGWVVFVVFFGTLLF